MSDEEYDLHYSEAEDDELTDMEMSSQPGDPYDADTDPEPQPESEPELEPLLLDALSEEMTAEAEPIPNHERLALWQIVDLMNKALQEVTEVIDLPSDQIRILLNHVNWDKNRVLELYFDNRNKLLADAHIVDPNLVVHKSKRRRKNELCLICYDEVSPNDMTSISCGHEFCIGKRWRLSLELLLFSISIRGLE